MPAATKPRRFEAKAAVHRAGSPDARIAALEKKIQYRLPPALYAYFRSSLRGPAGEIRHDPSLRAPIYEFLDAGGALRNWDVMIGIDDWEREWVPIAWDGAGNLHFVHAKKSTVGFACQDPHGRRHGKLPLERWLGQWNIELETFARKVAPLAKRREKKTRGGAITALWAALEKWLDGHERGPRFRASLNAGATEAEIAAAARRLGFDFPPDLRDFYRRHDGQNANKGAFIGREGTKFYPLKKVTNASHARLTERHLIIGGGKDYGKTTWLLTYDKKTGALDLFAPDLERYSRRPVAKSLQAWMQELVAGLPKAKVTLQSGGSFTWWGR
jgi:hypothetical protein